LNYERREITLKGSRLSFAVFAYFSVFRSFKVFLVPANGRAVFIRIHLWQKNNKTSSTKRILKPLAPSVPFCGHKAVVRCWILVPISLRLGAFARAKTQSVLCTGCDHVGVMVIYDKNFARYDIGLGRILA